MIILSIADLSVGSIHPTRSSGDVVVTKYNGVSDLTIRFINTETILSNVSGSNLRKGLVSDPNTPSLCEIGYIGSGPYSFKENIVAYRRWCAMICRVYRPTTERIKRSYEDCSVDPRWHNFQNFAEWYQQQPYNNQSGYELDKDLILEGNKVYGPETCCLIPSVLNLAITFIKTNRLAIGVFKEGNKFVAETRMKSSLVRRLGVYDNLEDAKYRYLEFRWSYIMTLAGHLHDIGKISDYHLNVVQRRFKSALKLD